LNEREKGGKDEEENISSCWMTLRKREGTGKLKRKHQIALSGELVLAKSYELS